MAIKMTTGGRLAAAMMMAAALSACTSGGLPQNSDFERIADTPIGQRNADANRSAQEAVNFLSEPAVTVLETSGSNALQLTTDAGQKVPDVPVGEINAQPMEFGPLLNQIAEQVGMSWRITGANKQDLLKKEVYYVQRSEITLKSVLDELSELTGAFYKVEGDRIIFSQDRLFVLRVPRMADSQEALLDGLSKVGVEETFSDKVSGTISFRANRDAYLGARRMIESFELGRDMIVYDFWIIEREITDNSSLAVGFGVAKDANNGLGFGDLTEIDGMDGATFSGTIGQMSVAGGVEFFRKLGNANTVARPTISMLSGGESSFNSTLVESYISSIKEESNKSEDANGDENVETVRTPEIDQVEVGVEIDVKGSYHANVISTDFNIDVSELLGFTEGSDGTRQPRTTSRNVEAHLEARPGDVMIIGGIIRERQNDAGGEVPGVKVPHSRSRDASKSEMLLLVRPRLVQIRPTKIEAPKAPLRVESGVGSLNLEENPIEGVMKDEERARALLEQMSK